MGIAIEASEAFHIGTDPIFALLTPDQIQRLAQLQGDAKLDARVTELAEKANEGLLSDAERAEYEAYIEANELLSILQAEARFRLTNGEI